MTRKHNLKFTLAASLLILVACETTGIANSQDDIDLPIAGEAVHIEELRSDALELLAADDFHANLVSLGSRYKKVWLSGAKKTRSPEQLSGILKFDDPTDSDIWRAEPNIVLEGAAIRDSGQTSGFQYGKRYQYAGVGYNGQRDSNGRSMATMNLGRVHLARYLSDDSTEKSCAINTMTHEISHTYSHHKTKYKEYFRDGTVNQRRAGQRPMASYLIGSVAQCTHLQRLGKVGATQPAFQKCVSHFGIKSFNTYNCVQPLPDDATP